MLFVTSCTEKYEADDPLIERLQKVKIPLFLVLNKTDLVKPEEVLAKIKWWNDLIPFKETIPASALNKKNTDTLLQLILRELPEGPEYYPKDQLTDRPERFFVSEIIREKVLELYDQEVPYSVEVLINSFKEQKTKSGEDMISIQADLFVARKTQKSILIGKDGSAIRRLGISSRIALEKWLECKVFLDLHVKVKDNWRDDDRMLKHFGYRH